MCECQYVRTAALEAEVIGGNISGRDLWQDERSMPTRLSALTRARFDLLVVGGGIHGLFAALEAARGGLRTALVEQNDVGSGLSFNHQRTIHGGLRALQTGNVWKARHQVLERRRWAEMAPAHVRPLPFVVGTYRGTKRSPGRIRAGFALYNAIASSRNHELPTPLHLPPGRLVSIDEVMARFPSVETRGLTGGAEWHDYQALRPDRLNWLVARAALDAGAVLVNHAEALAGVRRGGRIAAVSVRDVLSEERVDIEADTTLLAAGAGLPSLFDRFELDDVRPEYLAAANLLVDRAPLASAVAAETISGRMLTAVPWSGATLIGTFQSRATGVPGSPFPLTVDGMMAEANSAFPALALTLADVRLVHRGWTPATTRQGEPDLLADAVIIDHALRGVGGLVSLVGVKFTTARTAALDALRAASAAARWTWAAVPAAYRLPFGTEASPDVRDAVATFVRDARHDNDVGRHLLDWYGDESLAVVELARTRNLTARLGSTTPVIEGEIAYAAIASAACRLSDAVLRRTCLGTAGRPERAALQRAADVMGDTLGWSAERRTNELALVEERYVV
jgi:glycerol-3-phosphate dehydrogenase